MYFGVKQDGKSSNSLELIMRRNHKLYAVHRGKNPTAQHSRAEPKLNNSEEWIMTVLIDWNMVRWLLSIISILFGVAKEPGGVESFGLKWANEHLTRYFASLSFQLRFGLAWLVSSSWYFWKIPELGGGTRVDLLKTEPKRDGDRRTVFHFLCSVLAAHCSVLSARFWSGSLCIWKIRLASRRAHTIEVRKRQAMLFLG